MTTPISTQRISPAAKRIAWWIFAALSLVFLIWVLGFGPDRLPAQKHQLMGLASGGAAAFLGTFLASRFRSGRVARFSIVSGVMLKALGALVLFVVVLFWWNSEKSPVKVQSDFSQLEADLAAALKQLRSAPHASDAGVQSGFPAVTSLMIFADALAENGDARQQRVAADAKKEAGRILYGERSSAKSTAQGSAKPEQSRSADLDLGEHVEPYPGPLPEQAFTPLDLQRYVGTYAGTILGRPVRYIVSVTSRNLLGIRLVGLDPQPTMEFAEVEPRRFLRPDTFALVVFTDPTNGGFRTLVFQQGGMREKAENILYSETPAR